MNGSRCKKAFTMNDLLRGQLVHLTAENPEIMALNFARWNQDTGWERFLDSDPPRLFSDKKHREWIEKDQEKGESGEIFWAIKKLDDELVIGFIGLFNLFAHHG